MFKLKHCTSFACLLIQIEQDFSLMFGESVSGKFISKWPTFFKPKVIAECQKIPLTIYLKELLASFHPEDDSGNSYSPYCCCFVICGH